jgi:hypothetical protein
MLFIVAAWQGRRFAIVIKKKSTGLPTRLRAKGCRPTARRGAASQSTT